MKVIVEGTCESAKIDVKRLYLPGIVVKTECPSCGEFWRKDLGSTHLGFPTVGQPCNLYGYCHVCDHEWEVSVILRITVEPGVAQEYRPEEET